MPATFTDCLERKKCKNKTVLSELLYPISKAGGLGPLAIMALFMPLWLLYYCAVSDNWRIPACRVLRDH